MNLPEIGSIGQEMLETAKRARTALNAESKTMILQFIRSQEHVDGGFTGRNGESDLYYTYFGLESLEALGAPPPAESLRRFLAEEIYVDDLDLVHLSCFARCLVKLSSDRWVAQTAATVLNRLEQYRLPGGGYTLSLKLPRDSVYAAFLARLSYEALNHPMPHPGTLSESINKLRSEDSAWGDQPGLKQGTTTVTAAAVILLKALGQSVDRKSGDWLLNCASQHGGFLASPSAPIPDLLSTATAMFAMQFLGLHLSEKKKEAALSFIQTVWDESGGFCGHIMDTVPDSEYTFYGLLCLGALSDKIDDE